MKGRDEIKDLFSDKLGNFEAQVRPDMWSNIASQIGGTTTTVASSGLSLLSKTFIGLGIGAVVVTTILLVTPSSTVETDKRQSSQVSNTISSKQENILDNTIITEENEENVIATQKTNQVDNSLSPPYVNSEIDQTQNFRSEVSLINEKIAPIVIRSEEDDKKNINEKPVEIDRTKVNTGTIKQGNQNVKGIDFKEVDNIISTYFIAELPNIFTPNGDGNNDVFFITSEGLKDFTIVVLDEKQKVVFESNNPDFKWEGMDKFGTKVNPGTYGYYIIAQDGNGNKVNKFKSLQIIF